MDLAASVTITLPDSSINLLPTGIFVSPGPRKGALLIGKASSNSARPFVLPEVINYTGEIKIMAFTPFPPCTIPKGTCIAQLIPFSHDSVLAAGEQKGEVGGQSDPTGTSQILWVQTISDKCPTCKCTLSLQGQKIIITAIIDTGADVTVISQDKWPSNWPLTEVPRALTGIRVSAKAFKAKISFKSQDQKVSLLLLSHLFCLYLWCYGDAMYFLNGVSKFSLIFTWGH